MSAGERGTGKHWSPPAGRPASPVGPRPRGPAAAVGAIARKRVLGLILYGALGTLFGIVLTEAEILSWFRIQEMFRFQAFHMYGIIGAAVVVAGAGLRILRARAARAATGQEISVPPKHLGRGVRYVAGGLIFGVGWALTGACPGPLLALVGNGVPVILVAIASALAGVWTYGHLRPRLPH